MHYRFRRGHEDAVCYGHCELRGSVTWSASKKDAMVPSFFLNKGVTLKCSPSTGEMMNARRLPSTDTLIQLCRDPFFSSAKFTVPVLLGKVDEMCIRNDRIRLSLEDPVGYTAVEDDKNASVTIDAQHLDIEEFSKPDFTRWVDNVMSIPSQELVGDAPECM